MDGLLTFILFGALFYIMMRFGCGSHMSHGGHDKQVEHGNARQQGGSSGKTSDPVCGMEVEDSHGYGKMYENVLYRFCSRECLDKFDAEPKRYLNIKEGVGS